MTKIDRVRTVDVREARGGDGESEKETESMEREGMQLEQMEDDRLVKLVLQEGDGLLPKNS